MSENNLDLSKIVNLIMENPSLVAEISALAKGDKDDSQEAPAIEAHTEETSAEQSETVSSPPAFSKQQRRTQLLSAMKPYLSEERSRTIDTMMSIVGVLGSIRGK